MFEAKFRAIVDNDLNEWTYGYYIQHPDGTAYIHAEDGSQLRVKPETRGHYTGLKDKKGDEIYEGDIVRYKVNVVKPVGVVSYAGAQWIKGNSQALSSYQKTTEIIGDIYHNPELVHAVL